MLNIWFYVYVVVKLFVVVNVLYVNVLEFGGLDVGDDCVVLFDGICKLVN